ncbi:MAG TPA: multicopper oxidase family protein [Longimicrobium sp.]
MPYPRPILAAVLAASLAASISTSTAAQNVQAAAARRAPGGRCAYVEADIDRYGKQPFRNPLELRSANGRLSTTLAVRYTDPNTTSIAGCPVKLRSYNGQLVGPTLRVRPGDDLAPLLDNQLPREDSAEVNAQFQQENGSAFLDMRPYSFNTTNLHTHGLHVSPNGNSDNVLLAIQPQSRFQYGIRLPASHTRGTYWYHAHTHGSTAVQVGSGMAGALIVEDDPARIPPALRAANQNEKVMVVQTILYDTTGQANNITSFFPDPPSPPDACQTGGPTCTWFGSRRHTTINGQIVPVITMRPGEVQRWRVIDSSFRESIALQLQGHALHEIALDGIYTGRIDTWAAGQDLVLQPGYRSDILVQASTTPGDYQLIDDSASTGISLRGVAERAQLLAIVRIQGDPVDMKLPTQQEMAALNPFPGVQLPLTADGVQEAVFKLGSGLQPTDPRNSFQVNYEAFDDSRVRHLQLNKTDMWSLTTVGDPAAVPGGGVPPLPHIFHIHINPFQVYRQGPNGQPELVWKDTQLIPAGDTINIYTQYLDFTGTFVIHCHILDHEDLGMMEAVEVVRELPVPHPRPNGRPDAAGGMGGMSGHMH